MGFERDGVVGRDCIYKELNFWVNPEIGEQRHVHFANIAASVIGKQNM